MTAASFPAAQRDLMKAGMDTVPKEKTGYSTEGAVADYSRMYYMERPCSSHQKMPVEHRAVQFAPFAALKGFEKCIREEEQRQQERMELGWQRENEPIREERFPADINSWYDNKY